MNYRHAYHAGSFTDIFKHLMLVELLNHLLKKDKPFCFLDTHAGIGYYDLFSSPCQQTQEYKTGISKLLAAKSPPAFVTDYLAFLKKFNQHFSSDSFRFYPGSPTIANHYLRPQDKIIACELHPEDYSLLKSNLKNTEAAIHHMDAYLALKAFLPPPEKRGLILIDPPYEKEDEFKRLPERIAAGLKRFETGIFALWYPIKSTFFIQKFHQALKARIPQPLLILELMLYDAMPMQLNGCGFVIINPPWQFDLSCQKILSWLAFTLNATAQKPYDVYWLN